MSGCPPSPLLFNIIPKFLASVIRQWKEIKGIQVRKKEIKLPLFVDDTIAYYIEKPKESTKKILKS